MTARGSKIEVSAEALKSARQKLGSITQNTVNSNILDHKDRVLVAAEDVIYSKCDQDKISGTAQSGFKTARGSEIEVSAKSIEEARQKFCVNNQETKYQCLVEESKSLETVRQSFSGFTTAKGSNIKVSEKALIIAKQKLSEDVKENLDIKLVGDRKTSTITGASSAAMSRISHRSQLLIYP